MRLIVAEASGARMTLNKPASPATGAFGDDRLHSELLELPKALPNNSIM